MRARRWLILICLVGVFCVLIWYFLIRTDPLAEEVDRLIAAMPTRGAPATVDDLLALGPRVIPHLARNARQHESMFARVYRFAWEKLPNAARTWLKRPPNREPIRAAAMEAISTLGPLAVHGAAPAVVEGMTDPVQRVRVYAEYAIEWLVPENKDALKVYAQVLADTNRSLPIRSLTVSEAIWPKAPSLVPLQTRRLVQPEQAHVAAIALGSCRSNAISAIPALIETVQFGFAAPLSENDYRSTYTSLDHNRAMAAGALGSIGLATPEVIAVLTGAWNNSNALIRASAANAISALASNITSVPAELIAGLEERDNRALSAKLDAIRRIGPAARGALEAIQRFTDTNYLRNWVTEPNQNVMNWRVHDLAVAATIATCSIDPERCPKVMPQIAAELGQSWIVFQFLRGPHARSNEVISALVPRLGPTNEASRSSWAAYVILTHNRTHAEAIAVLQRNRTENRIHDRMFAVDRLFEVTGDTNGIFQIIDEGLSPGSPLGQWAVGMAGKIGSPAIPVLRRSLWHKDQFVRTQAGLWLRKIAPEELEGERGQRH